MLYYWFIYNNSLNVPCSFSAPWQDMTSTLGLNESPSVGLCCLRHVLSQTIFRNQITSILLMRTGGVTKIILCADHFYNKIIACFCAILRISALMYTFTRGVEVGIPTRVDRFSNLKNCKYFWKKLKNCKYFWKKLKSCKYFWKKLKSCKYFEKEVHLHSGEWRAQKRQFSRSFLKLEKLQSFC